MLRQEFPSGLYEKQSQETPLREWAEEGRKPIKEALSTSYHCGPLEFDSAMELTPGADVEQCLGVVPPQGRGHTYIKLVQGCWGWGHLQLAQEMPTGKEWGCWQSEVRPEPFSNKGEAIWWRQRMKGVSQNEGNAPTVTIGALNSLPFNQP